MLANKACESYLNLPTGKFSSSTTELFLLARECNGCGERSLNSY